MLTAAVSPPAAAFSASASAVAWVTDGGQVVVVELDPAGVAERSRTVLTLPGETPVRVSLAAGPASRALVLGWAAPRVNATSVVGVARFDLDGLALDDGGWRGGSPDDDLSPPALAATGEQVLVAWPFGAVLAGGQTTDRLGLAVLQLPDLSEVSRVATSEVGTVHPVALAARDGTVTLAWGTSTAVNRRTLDLNASGTLTDRTAGTLAPTTSRAQQLAVSGGSSGEAVLVERDGALFVPFGDERASASRRGLTHVKLARLSGGTVVLATEVSGGDATHVLLVRDDVAPEARFALGAATARGAFDLAAAGESVLVAWRDPVGDRVHVRRFECSAR